MASFGCRASEGLVPCAGRKLTIIPGLKASTSCVEDCKGIGFFGKSKIFSEPCSDFDVSRLILIVTEENTEVFA